MTVFNQPYIRDELTIDERVQMNELLASVTLEKFTEIANFHLQQATHARDTSTSTSGSQ